MDFDHNSKSEAVFAHEFRKTTRRFMGEWIEEIIGGFESEMDDVKIFFSENVR